MAFTSCQTFISCKHGKEKKKKRSRGDGGCGQTNMKLGEQNYIWAITGEWLQLRGCFLQGFVGSSSTSLLLVPLGSFYRLNAVSFFLIAEGDLSPMVWARGCQMLWQVGYQMVWQVGESMIGAWLGMERKKMRREQREKGGLIRQVGCRERTLHGRGKWGHVSVHAC